MTQRIEELSANKALCERALHLMGDGTLGEFRGTIHPDATNREAAAEPPATRGHGPEAYYATALWLRDAYADLKWEVHDLVAEGDLVVLHTTMSGRQVKPFVSYDADGKPAQAFPATGRTFAVTQSHWMRVQDSMVIEHWANRDDLGNATQLGWIPPTPVFLLRMFLATRRARAAG
ncbi:ester cyclase [Kribbella sp. NPDC056861]|uniref:ester cyclase n=1 Tax=Kribbella sp. NPDC056861 TaxID=3154857 RepID=UPI003419CBF9